MDSLFASRRVRGERLSNQPRLCFQVSCDIVFEIVSERSFCDPQENGDGQRENQDGSEDQPFDEGHRFLARRSFPLKR